MKTKAKEKSLFKSEFKPELETFLNIGYARRPVISPDGETIYFFSSLTEKEQLLKITENNNYPIQVTFRENGIMQPAISPDGKWMIFLDDNQGNEHFQIYLLETKTGRFEALTDKPQNVHQSVIWAPDSKTIFFQARTGDSNDYHIYSMDLTTGEIAAVWDKTSYASPGCVSKDGRYLLIFDLTTNFESDIYLLNLMTGESKKLTSGKNKSKNEIVTLSPDNKTLYYITSDTPHSAMKLSKMDMETGQSRIIFDSDSPWDIDFVVANDSSDVLAVVVNENGYGILKLLDLKTMELLPAPELKGLVTTVSFSKTSKIAFAFQSPAKTSEIYTWDWQTRKLTQKTFSSYAGIAQNEFVEPRLIHYKSFDGLEIPAFLYLPENRGKCEEKIPFLIFFHGGPACQERPEFMDYPNYLLANGIGYMIPNIRGSSGYGKEYADLDNYKKRMDAVKDGYYAAKYLIDEGYSEKGRIAVSGSSYGGFMTMALITEYPDMWAAACEMAGVINFVTFMNNMDTLAPGIMEEEFGPLADEEFLRSISPIHKIDRIKTPLLVLHGKNDSRVPVSEAYQVIENLENRGIEVKSLIVEDLGHSFRSKDDKFKVFNEMVEFFKEHLK
jgi:dipeptidyl aminopeptidase/acylaminoacyl peptidase